MRLLQESCTAGSWGYGNKKDIGDELASGYYERKPSVVTPIGKCLAVHETMVELMDLPDATCCCAPAPQDSLQVRPDAGRRTGNR